MITQEFIKSVTRNWGYFLQFCENEKTTVKLLHVKKRMAISYQYHEFRSEQWYVIKGKILVTKGPVSEILLPGQTITIQPKEKHKLEGMEESLVLEISKGFFDENDIVRL